MTTVIITVIRHRHSQKFLLTGHTRKHTVVTGCLTLLEILEIYLNYFSSWKS